MLEKKVSALLRIGTRQEYLERVVTAGVAIHGDRRVLEAINDFFADLEELGLTVTLRAATKLRELQDGSRKLLWEAKWRKIKSDPWVAS
jgi:hypothetical protein